MKRNAVTLYLENNFWMVRFSGPHAGSIVRLFGTDALPTPFTGDADPVLVVDTVQRMNPGVIVFLEAK
jgi:hypothetical protein